jgi:adenylosuccinate synthase
LLDWESFKTKFIGFYNTLAHKYSNIDIMGEDGLEAELAKYEQLRERLLPMIVDTAQLVNKEIMVDGSVLLEGANAHMLDIDHGTYPFVTSSNCTVGGAATGLGIPPKRIGHVLGVAKAYLTRVGSGPFPTELNDSVGEYLQQKGHEFGTTTGRKRRCGWIDIPMLKYSVLVNGFDAICLTKLDVLSGLSEVKIGVAYKLNGKTVKEFPQSLDDLAKVEVVYETMPGWTEDISKVRRFEDLPMNAQNFVNRVQELLSIKERKYTPSSHPNPMYDVAMYKV